MKQLAWILRIVVAGLLLGGGAWALFGQTQTNTPAQPATSCNSMPYLQQSQFNRKLIELGEVHGTAVDQNGVPLENVCVGLFSFDSRTLVRAARTGTNGEFSIDTKGLPDGTYRLVGQFIGFCPANAIITVNSHSPVKNPLAVHMNLPGNPDCSTVNVKSGV
jgi:Carboxypeptidase regulatory-like domain